MTPLEVAVLMLTNGWPWFVLGAFAFIAGGNSRRHTHN